MIRYWESIGHAIHSMDVQSLQMFNPKATEDNKIPTVNMNLHSSQKVLLPSLPFTLTTSNKFNFSSSLWKVLDNAPHNPLPQEFETSEMNLIDRVLTRVGVSDDGLGANWTPLERIVHNFHMIDLWNKIKPVCN